MSQGPWETPSRWWVTVGEGGAGQEAPMIVAVGRAAAEGAPREGGGEHPVTVVVNVDGRSVALGWRRWDLRRARLWVPIDAVDEVGAAERGRERAGQPPPAEGVSVDVLVGPVQRTPDGGLRREVVVAGWRFVVDLEAEARAALRERARRGGRRAAGVGPLEVRAAIPGRVVAVGAGPGTTVAAGGTVVVVEAMKMQNEVRAPRAGRVAAVAVAPGATVEMGDLLFVLE